MPLHARTAHLIDALAACGVLAAVPASAGAAGGPAPVSDWAFDNGTGTTAADRVGGHTATLMGGAGWTAPTTREITGLCTSTKLVLPPSSVTVLRVTGA